MQLPIRFQQQPWSYLARCGDVAAFLPKRATAVTPVLFYVKVGDALHKCTVHTGLSHYRYSKLKSVKSSDYGAAIRRMTEK